ncbi:MAG: hypothetical protein J1E85_04470 [Ruminococcus sp.]|nr:hypothetical protein [Ruminococcus sp.]
MYIVLTQKKDFKSEYKDELFHLYHFPAKYLSKINSGDRFIYHQGEHKNAGSKKIRYYYGTGVIGDIYTKDDGVTYYAELKQCKQFYNNVPIKSKEGQYWEQIGVQITRQKPDWQNSIRSISSEAFMTIVNMSGGLINVTDNVDVEAIKFDLKMHIDDFYLDNNHQSLIDILSLSTQLIQAYGVMVK